MNKEDVSKALGCSTRQIEKFASEGRLGERVYVRGKRGRQADYKPEEVERLKGELERERAEVIGHAATFAGVQALQRGGGEQGMSMLASVLADALRAAHAPGDGRHDTTPPVELKDKLMLTEREAAAYAGLSLADIERARASVKAIKTGAGWRVKRTALEAYVKRL
jgi:hypothetical protein